MEVRIRKCVIILKCCENCNNWMMGILPGLGKVYTVEKRAGRLVPTPSWLQDLVTMYKKMERKGVMNIITLSVA